MREREREKWEREREWGNVRKVDYIENKVHPLRDRKEEKI